MTPEERNLVSELFDRLATLEDAQRDPDAERAIRDGLRQAPNAIYALVQTALVQDEALKRADARIQELEEQLANGAEPPRSGGFLGGMRDNLMGRRPGSVPSVPRADAARADAPMGAPGGYAPGGYAAGAQPMGQPGYPGPGAPAAPGGSGGSFLGTAAAAAAGMIGGSLLLNGIRGMMGGHQQSAGGFGTTPAAAGDLGGTQGSPWGGSGSGGGLSREAGLDDIGRGGARGDDSGAGRSQGLFGNNDAEQQDNTQYAANEEQGDAEDDAGDVEDDDGDLGDDGGDGGDE